MNDQRNVDFPLQCKTILLSENLAIFHPKVKGILESKGARVIQLINDAVDGYGRIDGIVIYHDHYMTSMLLISLAATHVVLLTGKDLGEAKDFHQYQSNGFPHHYIQTIAFDDANRSAMKIAEKVAFLFSDKNSEIKGQIIEISSK